MRSDGLWRFACGNVFIWHRMELNFQQNLHFATLALKSLGGVWVENKEIQSDLSSVDLLENAKMLKLIYVTEERIASILNFSKNSLFRGFEIPILQLCALPELPWVALICIDELWHGRSENLKKVALMRMVVPVFPGSLTQVICNESFWARNCVPRKLDGDGLLWLKPTKHMLTNIAENICPISSLK